MLIIKGVIHCDYNPVNSLVIRSRPSDNFRSYPDLTHHLVETERLELSSILLLHKRHDGTKALEFWLANSVNTANKNDTYHLPQFSLKSHGIMGYIQIFERPFLFIGSVYITTAVGVCGAFVFAWQKRKSGLFEMSGAAAALSSWLHHLACVHWPSCCAPLWSALLS